MGFDLLYPLVTIALSQFRRSSVDHGAVTSPAPSLSRLRLVALFASRRISEKQTAHRYLSLRRGSSTRRLCFYCGIPVRYIVAHVDESLRTSYKYVGGKHQGHISCCLAGPFLCAPTEIILTRFSKPLNQHKLVSYSDI